MDLRTVRSALNDALGAAHGGDMDGVILAVNVAIERLRLANPAPSEVGRQKLLDAIRDEVVNAVEDGDRQDDHDLGPDAIGDLVYEIVRVALRDAASPPEARESLDRAWEEAEAAASARGLVLQGVWNMPEDIGPWEAGAGHLRDLDQPRGHGPTPTAALQALTRALTDTETAVPSIPDAVK